MLDSGLLSNFLGKETQVSIISKTIKGNTKGGVYENVIAEELTKKIIIFSIIKRMILP